MTGLMTRGAMMGLMTKKEEDEFEDEDIDDKLKNDDKAEDKG